jgi:hypothetical protein
MRKRVFKLRHSNRDIVDPERSPAIAAIRWCDRVSPL